jgi:hypothetical protein
MIEILAASRRELPSVWPAWAAMGVGKRNDEARDAVIRLTASVEHIAEQLDGDPYVDMRDDDRREHLHRLNSVEQRVSKLEAQPRI